jgi:hypothetical protein
MIVPRSSQLIIQDQEYGLFTVTLFKKVIEEFKLHAREKKFIVRDFTYNEEELAAGESLLIFKGESRRAINSIAAFYFKGKTK